MSSMSCLLDSIQHLPVVAETGDVVKCSVEPIDDMAQLFDFVGCTLAQRYLPPTLDSANVKAKVEHDVVSHGVPHVVRSGIVWLASQPVHVHRTWLRP
jgi:hypothetical protein